MKNNILRNILIPSFALVSAILGGCIKNDLPYPRVQQNIRKLVADGELRSAQIDSTACEVTVFLEETVDIQNVKFKSFEYTPGAETSVDLHSGTYDLSKPIIVTLHKFYDYDWVIKGEQTIERYFSVVGQIGESVVDPIGHRVIVTMPEGTDLTNLTLEQIKLGPAGLTTIKPALVPGKIDLSYPLKISVECYGRSEDWVIYVDLSELVVSTSSVDAWSEVIWAYGDGPSDVKNGFQYRESGATEWIDVPESRVTQNQGAFSCYIPHLKQSTAYEVRTVSGNDFGNVVEVTTQGTAELPDGDFENWCQIGKVVFPYAEGGTQFWDTGNTGSSTLGQNLTVSSDHTPHGVGKSAECSTKFVGIAGIGKLGAGSIFTGRFQRVDGTNGILDFGRPWSLRPTKLRGYFQYKTKAIDYVSTELASLKGEPDTCVVYVALTDWTTPYEIRTNPKTRNLFDKNASYIVGYGEMEYSGTMDDFKEFVIDINYKDTSKIPSYIQITCSTSKYGDYFTGADGAVLWVDEFSFEWDLP